MPNQPTYLFYDIETTGLNKCFDQVMQFAAIRTDIQFNELERHEWLVRLNPDVIPSPEAIITHRISLKQCQTGLSEVEAIQKIHGLLNTPNTISIGYNIFGFDDEFLRFSFYRNLLTPYTHQYANQCSRMDLYPITVLYNLFKPEALNWPEIAGKISLKLENLSAANNLAVGQAHTAMVDVEACVTLAKKLYQHPDIWQYACSYFNKQQDLERINKLENDPALILDGKIGATNQFIAAVMPLGFSKPYKNQSLWLRLDHTDLNQTTIDNLTKNTYVLRKKPGEELLLLPTYQRYLEKISPERQTMIEKNKHWLSENNELLQHIRDYYQHYTYPKIEGIDIDAALYDSGFTSDHEQRLFQRFHLADPADKITTAEQFPNKLHFQLAQRIIARNYPQLLSDAASLFIQQSPHIDYRGEAKLTAEQALTKIADLRLNQQLDPKQTSLLDELQQFLQ